VRTSAQARFRPSLETLDARDVPAALTWTNAAANNDFYTPANWNLTGTTTVSAYAPVVGDDVTFDGTVSSADCDNLGVLAAIGGEGGPVGGDGEGGGEGGSGSGTTGLHSLSLINGYAGTVTIVAPVQTGTFTLTAASTGAISQPSNYTGNDLTVTDTFTWTSGILNSSSHEATVRLQGAAGVVSPGVGNAITTGSTIRLEARNGNGGTLEFNPGQLTFNNDAGLIIDQFCRADVKPQQNATVTFTANLLTVNSRGITLNTDGNLTVTGPGSWDALGLPMVNSGGVFEIKNNAIVSFAALPNTGMYTVTQTAGTIKLHTGTTLNASSFGLRLSGGTLHTIGDSPAGVTAPATLGGDLWFSSGVLTFEGTYCTFKVTGDVKWEGGAFGPRLDVSQDGVTDVWEIIGKLTIPNNSTAQILPATFNWNSTAGIPAAWRWQSLKFGSVQLPANGALPTVGTVPGNAPMQLFIGVENGKTVWKLGSNPS
jgi:hypothetical protein